VLRVGPTHAIKTIAEAAALARDRDTVEIDAGEYRGDVAVWSQRDLTLRGVGGRARLVAFGASAEDKAIWVMRGGGRLTVENIEFVGAKVPDHNGAGIRLEKGDLVVRNALFEDNEDGVLVGNDESIELDVEASEFRHNGGGDGSAHGLYAGLIGRLTIRGCYFHRGNIGHLIKSRARENYILYNRITDEYDGRASYELEFANGGLAVVIGNLIQQGPEAENSTIVVYGTEGYRWPSNEFYFVHNTVVNDRSRGGVFVRVLPAAGNVKIVNNIFVGKGEMDVRSASTTDGNIQAAWSEFLLPARLDFRLRAESKLIGKARDPAATQDRPLRPMAEYVYPTGTRALAPKQPLSPGAFQIPGG
jgi:hypothetical protein